MMILPKTFGRFIEMDDKPDYLMISFPFTTLPVQERWRNNGLSADFLANYWETCFPLKESVSPRILNETKDAIRYIANELLENAVKFNYPPSQKPITIGFHLSEHELRFHITNSINPQHVEQFQQYIQQLLTGDPDELYILQLERNASEENSTESRLGLLTIFHNYQAQVAWKFDRVSQYPETVMVTTMVQLEIERLQRRGLDPESLKETAPDTTDL